MSVLVAAWNAAHEVADLVESFRALPSPPAELILGAGGPDGTFDRARQLAGRGVRVLEQRSGEGKQGALRRCLAASRGQVIVLTDADCRLSGAALSALLEPIFEGTEEVTTGVSRPLASQMQEPFVVYQWASQRATGQGGPYSEGLLGRACALRREALLAAGAFEPRVRTGTDYHLARRLRAAGYRLRLVPAAEVETRYPTRLIPYIRQQSRWLRNLLLHGHQFGAAGDARHALWTGGVGAALIAMPVLALWWRPLLLLWGAAYAYGLTARLRRLAALRRERGVAIPTAVYPALPLYQAADALAWALALVEAAVPAWRERW